MLRFWGINLKGLFDSPPTVSPDEVLWLYEQLPDNAATKRSPDGESGQWEISTQLQAANFNATQINTHAFIAAHSKKAPKPPQLILPPGETKKREQGRVLTAKDIF
jgi:hypothetical protein